MTHLRLADAAEYAESLSKAERSCLLYIESCVVDHDGLLESRRMDRLDKLARMKFAQDGVAVTGRIPHALLRHGRFQTHWAELSRFGWAVAWELRRQRSAQKSLYSQTVFATVKGDAEVASGHTTADC